MSHCWETTVRYYLIKEPIQCGGGGGERGGGVLCDATGAVVIQFVYGRVWKLSELNCTEGHSPLCCTVHNSIV